MDWDSVRRRAWGFAEAVGIVVFLIGFMCLIAAVGWTGELWMPLIATHVVIPALDFLSYLLSIGPNVPTSIKFLALAIAVMAAGAAVMILSDR
jgi:hypothetical protein